MKQKAISWTEKTNVYDEYQNLIYTSKSKLLSMTKRIEIRDVNDNLVGEVRRLITLFMATYEIFVHGELVARVKQKFSMLKPKLDIQTSHKFLTLQGDWLAHNFSLFDYEGNRYLTVNKEYLTWGDTYQLDIADNVDPIMITGLLLAIDNLYHPN